MPRQFRGGTDRLSWPHDIRIDATQPEPITLTGWANSWRSNSTNDRWLIQKADFGHQTGLFSIFLGGFDPGFNTNQTFAFWHTPWFPQPGGKWAWLNPADDNWHFWSVRYHANLADTIEVPDVRFDLIPATFLADISAQPSGIFLSEIGQFYNEPGTHTNPSPYPIDIANTLNSGNPSYNGAFWRFSWWKDYLTDRELYELYVGKRPELIRYSKMLFHCELDGVGPERDNGPLQLGQATIIGTPVKSLDSPGVYLTPRPLERGLRRPLMEKGSSPTGNVTIAGQTTSSGQGSIVATVASKSLTSLSASLLQGATKANVVEPLTGQTMASGQGTAGPVNAPVIFVMPGQQAASATGTVTPEDAISLPGQQSASQQGIVNPGFQSTIILPGQTMSIVAAPLPGGPGPQIKTKGLQSIQGQLYIDAQTEFVQQVWKKVEGPP